MAVKGLKTAVLMLMAVVVLGGCGLPSKQVDSNSANISILANRTNNLKADMGQIRSQVDKLVIQVTGLNEKLDAVSEQRRAEPAEEIAEAPRPEGERVDREVMLLEQELSIIERRLNDLETSKTARVPSIKVLAGSTDLQPAKDMAAFLARNGFPVKAVDFASSAGYSYDTIYYSEGYEGQAQQIAETLGGRTVIKPLSWKSVFDIIAVKGELE